MRAKTAPLWRDLRGNTIFRAFSALILDDLCLAADLTTEDLLRGLRTQLHRKLSRQTLAAWRRGNQAVPAEVLLATGVIVRRTLADASIVVAMKVLADDKADPDFAQAMRTYYGQGRAQIPPD